MAHSYENFMGNKDFHPGSFRNLKKVWEAKEQLKMEEKRQEELRLQYLKEQEAYKAKELIGQANPMGFMYEPPPSFAKDNKDQVSKEGEEDNSTKLKFDWQRQDKAPPRESYAKDNERIVDQPFGIEVRNVKCIKCGKWGHVNTDRECPLFGKPKPGSQGKPFEQPIITDWDSINDGLRFKQCVKERVIDTKDPLQQIVVSDDEETAITDMLAQFSPHQRKKILKKLKRAESKDKDDRRVNKSKHKDRSEKRRHRKKDSDSDEEEDIKKVTKKRKKRKRRTSSSCSSSDDEQWMEKSVSQKNEHIRRKRTTNYIRH